jgi:signal transduction histidine kinase
VSGEIASKLPVEGSTSRMVFRFLHKDGTWRFLEGTGRSMLEHPGVRGIVTNCRDITDGVKTKRKLKAALDQAREATELKSRFLANMSHEIRTPMNGVVGLSELLLDTQLTSEQREYVEGIQFSADVLLRVINDILDFSKIEAGKLQIDVAPFNLRATLAGVADLFAPLCRQKALDFRFDIAPEVPTLVLGDGLRLRQVLSNLLSNALKFTAAGSIKLSADATLLSDRQASIAISVRDTGIGIPLDQQAKLFSSFTQGDSSTTRQFGGTGLGLAISKQLLQLMGGSIRLQSSPGRGTEFSFDLPLTLATPTYAMSPPVRKPECLPAFNRC